VREPLRRVHDGITRLLESISIADMSHDEDVDPNCGEEPARFYAVQPAEPVTSGV
jgi:hypothetical protein